jgi:hypothetical protein
MAHNQIIKLIFKDGLEQPNVPIVHELNLDALNVCKLLAINPEDLASR